MRLARTEDAAYLARGSTELRDLLLASELGADFPFCDLSESEVSDLYAMMDWFATDDLGALAALRRQISDGEHQYVCFHHVFTDGADRFSVDFGRGWRRTYLYAMSACRILSHGIADGDINWSQVPGMLRDLVRDQLPVILVGARDDLRIFDQEELSGTSLRVHRFKRNLTIKEKSKFNLWEPLKLEHTYHLLNLWPMIHPEGTCPMMVLVPRDGGWEERRGPWKMDAFREAITEEGGVLVADDARTQWSQLARGWLLEGG